MPSSVKNNDLTTNIGNMVLNRRNVFFFKKKNIYIYLDNKS